MNQGTEIMMSVEQYVRALFEEWSSDLRPRSPDDRRGSFELQLRRALKALKSNNRDSEAIIDLKQVIIEALQNDSDAWRACMNVAAEEIENGREIPPLLNNLVVSVLRWNRLPPPRKRGRAANRDVKRNFVISAVVYGASQAADLPVTRNQASRDQNRTNSACAVVARVLPEFGINLSESAVEKIWQRTQRNGGFNKDEWDKMGERT